MSAPTFRAACLQLNSGNDVEANLAAIGALLDDAARDGADFACLPENAFYMRGGDGEVIPEWTPDSHPGIALCRAKAVAHGLWILAGSIFAVSPDTQRRCNRSLLIDPQGTIVTAYDKIHLFDVTLPGGEAYRESERIAPGAALALADLPWGRLGMSVCYDLRFPHLYRDLAKAGADLLTVPAAFAETTGKAHWHVLLRARAIENGCFVIAPAQGGTHPGGRRTYGHSLIISPWGDILAEADGETPGVLYAEIEMEKVAAARRAIPCLTHDRPYVQANPPPLKPA